jgi:hypothetical protein
VAGFVAEGNAGAFAAGGISSAASRTDRAVAKELADFEMNVKVLKVVGMWNPFMKEFMGKEEEAKREREGKE